MPKLKATIVSKQVVVFDSGDIPANLIKDVLTKNEGTFDGNWALGDVARNGSEVYTTESVEVEEIKAGSK